MKHIDVKLHYIQDNVEAQDIDFEYVLTTLNFANVLVKVLDHLKHWQFMDMLGVQGKLNG